MIENPTDKRGLFIVIDAEGNYRVNNPQRPTVRYWTMLSVVESWLPEYAPGGRIVQVTQEEIDEINEQLGGHA